MVHHTLLVAAGLSAALILLGGCGAQPSYNVDRPFMGTTTSPARSAQSPPKSRSAVPVTVQLMPQLASTASPGFKSQTVALRGTDDAAFASVDLMPQLSSTASAGTQGRGFKAAVAGDSVIVKKPDSNDSNNGKFAGVETDE